MEEYVDAPDWTENPQERHQKEGGFNEKTPLTSAPIARWCRWRNRCFLRSKGNESDATSTCRGLPDLTSLNSVEISRDAELAAAA